MKIVRLKVKNYRGIEALDTPIAERGVIATGGNGKGKTSVLRAIRDALAAQDIGPHAIRLGADKAEILVDLDDVSVRRVITRKGAATLRVETRDGDRKAKPQTWLNDLLGTAPLDPLDFFLADPKARRAIILGALPVKLTAEQLPEAARADASPQILGLHGLEACAELHRLFYDRRASANAAVKQQAAHVAELDTSVAQMASQVPAGTPTTEVARAEADRAHAETVRLDERARRAAEQGARVASCNEQIATLRAEAADARAAIVVPPTAEAVDAAEQRASQAQARVRDLEAELLLARREASALETAVVDLIALRNRAATAELSARAIENRAADLIRMIAAEREVAPTPEEIKQAAAAHDAARAQVNAAQSAARLAEVQRERDTCRRDLAAATAHADELTATVDALAKTVPAALIAASDGIPGLGIDGDTITLDGLQLDGLSGGEQMRFAIDLARRANVKAKILIVDGLERIDRDTIGTFIGYATRDGWQLIASRVDRGDMILEAIAPERAEANQNNGG